VNPLYEDETKHIFTDGSNILVIDVATMYLYDLDCGGIKMFHVFSEDQRQAREIVEALEMVPICRCHRPPVRFVDKNTPDPVQQTIANIFVGLGTCRSVEDVKLMLEHMASQEEMRDLGQVL
jgi:hypothetical protein